MRLKALVDAGRLGTPILASARVKWYRPPSYYAGSRWRGTRALDGGGALINQGVHTVDLLLWLFGPVRRVYGEGRDAAARDRGRGHGRRRAGVRERRARHARGDDLGVSGYPRRVELTGSKARRSSTATRWSRWICRMVPGPPARPGPRAPENAGSPVVSDVTPHRAVLEDFIRAVNERARPACDGAEGRRSVEVITAIYQASRTGAPVDVT